ncbi:MAG TPA: GNAT family N-acetyltransferase [Anaerolineae bacterium]|nr:GNAT family N-acetyltransferase [Anaerolineae bacterium]
MAEAFHDHFIVRRPELADLDAVAALINACAQADIGEDSHITASWLGRVWTVPSFDPNADAWLVTTRDGRLAGYADFGLADPPQPFEVSGWVHPDFRGRGIGAYLLRRVEERAQHTIAIAAPDVWLGLQTSVYASSAAARELLRHNGYVEVRRWLRMLIEMDAPPPAARLPDGITLRAFRRGEEDRAVYEAVEDAMADEWEHPALSYEIWRHYKIDQEPNFDPTLWFLAVDGDQIAGVAICRWERPGKPNHGHVRDLGVRRPWRRRGIALALLQHAFGEFYRRGKLRVSLGVDATSLTGAERLYLKAGMRADLETSIYEKELRPGKREK